MNGKNCQKIMAIFPGNLILQGKKCTHTFTLSHLCTTFHKIEAKTNFVVTKLF